ncbi:MAG: SigB/SigF/SigG family RNA polymerase sigma factor [Jatrophihabitantaceae bacterium]
MTQTIAEPREISQQINPQPPGSDTEYRPGRLDSTLRAKIKDLLIELRALPEAGPERAAVRDELVVLNTPLVRYLARRFKETKEPLDDLVQVGMIGLLKAIDRFEPSRGLEFSTYAVPTILGEIKRYFRDATWAVHVPRGARDLHSAIVTARAELNQQLGRSLTVADIAERVRASEHEVLAALDAGRAYTSSSLESMNEAMGEGREAGFGFVDCRLEQVERRADLQPAISTLPEREQKVLVLRFVYDQSQTQIAEALGVSQMQISRLLARSMNQLRDELLKQRSAHTGPGGARRARGPLSIGRQRVATG